MVWSGEDIDMMQPFTKLGLLIVASISLMACGAPRPAADTSANQPPGQAQTGPKKIVAAVQGNPVGAYGRLDPNSSERGKAEVATMLSGALTVMEPSGELQP